MTISFMGGLISQKPEFPWTSLGSRLGAFRNERKVQASLRALLRTRARFKQENEKKKKWR
jgi:hypothetical protein